MKRIAIDARMWRSETGGIGRYTRNLVTELLKIDEENEYTLILTPADAAECTLKAKNLKQLIVDIHHYSLAEQWELVKVLNKEKFDLVHFTSFNHPILYRRPFICTVHDLIMHFYPSGNSKNSLFRRLAYKLTMHDTRRAKRILVPSEATKRDLVSKLHFPKKKIEVTLEGSETELFHPHTAKEIAAIKQKFQLPERYIIFVSRWEKYKGLIELVTAFETIHQEFPDIALVITGKPRWQAPEVGELITARQRSGLPIITPGFVDDADLGPLYSAATLYVHPSWYEGFGIMILEAFASKVPVITSNISSLPEVAGDAALLVNPHEPKEITGAIREILRNPEIAKTLTERGLQRVGLFSWKKMTAETHAAYLKALTA